MRSALAAGFAPKMDARSTDNAKAGLKVFARMTKDRVKLDPDSKWRKTITIYPVRGFLASGREERAGRARGGPLAFITHNGGVS